MAQLTIDSASLEYSFDTADSMSYSCSFLVKYNMPCYNVDSIVKQSVMDRKVKLLPPGGNGER